eukprot:gene52641-64332_t
MPVWLGRLDHLLLPFVRDLDDETLHRKLKGFWIYLDRVLPDAFMHVNIGPDDHRLCRLILRIDGELLPGRSIALLQQVLSRVKFNTDPAQLRRGLVENHLLARDVEGQLNAQSRADLDATVEIEAGNLLEQYYGRDARQDMRPFLRQPQPLDSRRLREVLAPSSSVLVANSLVLGPVQEQAAAKVESLVSNGMEEIEIPAFLRRQSN